MSRYPADFPHGTLDTLILKTLTGGPRHGYAIGRWIEEATNCGLELEEGSLYPALYRMERRGWLASAWSVTETGRRARFYKLTRTGRSQLDAETASWLRLTTAVADVLNG